MLLLVTIGLVLVGAISLVIGFVSSSLAPIYLSIACSILAGAVLVVFSRMSRRQGVPAAGGAPAPAASAAAAAPASERPTEVVGAATQTSAPVVPDLPFPIEDYDDLKVNEIVPLLPELDLDELDLVREREEQGKNRATIVKRIDELTEELEAAEARLAEQEAAEAAEAAMAASPVAAAVEEPTVATAAVPAGGGGLPIDDYDSLSVAEVLPLLPELDDDELETIAEYEETHKNRAQILRRIDEIFETGEVAGAAAEKLGVSPAAAGAKKTAAKKTGAKKTAAKTAAKKAAKKTAAKKAAAPAKKAAAAGGAKKAATPAKKAAAPAGAKKTAAKKTAAKKAAAPAKKAAAAPAKKAATKKAASKKAAAPAKKATKKR